MSRRSHCAPAAAALAWRDGERRAAVGHRRQRGRGQHHLPPRNFDHGNPLRMTIGSGIKRSVAQSGLRPTVAAYRRVATGPFPAPLVRGSGGRHASDPSAARRHARPVRFAGAGEAGRDPDLLAHHRLPPQFDPGRNPRDHRDRQGARARRCRERRSGDVRSRPAGPLSSGRPAEPDDRSQEAAIGILGRRPANGVPAVRPLGRRNRRDPRSRQLALPLAVVRAADRRTVPASSRRHANRPSDARQPRPSRQPRTCPPPCHVEPTNGIISTISIRPRPC